MEVGRRERLIAVVVVTVAEGPAVYLWLRLDEAGQVVAAGVLLVLMHLKHHVEIVAARDTPFREGLLAPRTTFASAMEAAGAVACLALLLDGQPALAAVALTLGFLIEHTLLVDELQSELERRDTRLPRMARS